MKIGLVLCANLEKAQYLYKYIGLLDSMDCDYDIIFWNRELSDFRIATKGNYISYNEAIDSFKPFIFKIKSYIKYSIFVHKQIKKYEYDKLIVFTSPAAFSIMDLCFGKYKKSYLFDYRDLTKEYINIYKNIIQKLAYNAALFTTSSPGYLCNFDTKKLNAYALCHNTFDDFCIKKKYKKNETDPIRIVYWGAVRQFEYNKNICKIFGNDNRFVLVYHGDGCYYELEKYCKNNNISNVYFTGKYCLNQIESFANQADIVFNAYETDFVTTPSLAVKIYDSVMYSLPIIVSANSFMEKYLEIYKHVFVFSLRNETILDDLYDWYRMLDVKKVQDSIDRLYYKICNDEKIFEKKLKEFVK